MFSLGGSLGCGTSRPFSPLPEATGISITPATNASMDVGTTLQFTASAVGATGRVITVPIAFNSSDTRILTVASNGLGCAGSWDSLTSPAVCTPGPSGVATVTANVSSTSSSPVTVYVHQHVDKLTIAPINPPAISCTGSSPGGTVGLSQAQSVIYESHAFSKGDDVTPSVGPLTFTQVNASVVKLDQTILTLLSNQVQATADAPGLTQISVSAAGVTSSFVNFETCPVQSITLEVTGASGSQFSVTKGSSKTITPTVLDTMGVTLTGLQLTWSASEPAAVAVSSSGVVTTALVGGGDVIASCIPPSCNTGITPPLPIYPNAAMAFTVASTSSNTGQTTTAFVTSTGCSTNFGCTTNLVPITVPGNVVGNSSILPNPPNSFIFSRQGTRGYLGSQNGLMVLDPTASPPTVTTFPTVTGKVLTVSPNNNLIVVSDTTTNPNQVFIFSQTGTSSVRLPITGATAAVVSPDNLRVFIAAGTNLYVYSTLEPLKTISLTAPIADLTFLPVGSFAFLAGGAPSANGSEASVSAVDACTNVVSPPFATTANPTAIRALVDGSHFLALDSPGIDLIEAVASPSPTSGCGTVSIVLPPALTQFAFVNLGQGKFTPLRFLVTTDSTKAYILSQELGSVIVYDVGGQTSTAIPLVGNVKPLSGDVTVDGTMLYIGATDNLVHAVSTVAGGDLKQITFPLNFNLCNNVSYTCAPDLIAIQP
jgi:trimeric autotransporter adhesin